MASYIVLGVFFLIVAFLIGIGIGRFLGDDGNPATVFGLSFLGVVAMVGAVLCLLSAGRAKIETHEVVKPVRLIQETEQDGHVVKDTTYIYSFKL